jgi:chromosome-anchoring protein RacA
MEALLKTRDVSKELGVNTKTIVKWVNFFDISCPKNELGHYVFRPEDVQNLKKIQSKLNKGLPMRQVVELLEDKTVKENQKSGVVDKKFDQVFSRLDELERKIHLKADEVLSYQVLQHRRELESFAENLTKIEDRLLFLEQNFLKEIVEKKEEVTILSSPRRRLKKAIQI